MHVYVRTIAYLTIFAALILGTNCGAGSSQSPQPTQPTTPLTNVATGSHILGDANAKVTIVEFSDFQCPYCKNFFTSTEQQIIADYVVSGKVKIAYRQFPLSMHQNAQIAAEASECAAKVGGNDAFWKYHNRLFTDGQGDGTGLDTVSLKRYAADLQLDTTTFNACLDTHELASRVAQDVADANAAGVSGTPTFFINGKMLVGAQPYSTFKSMIDAAL